MSTCTGCGVVEVDEGVCSECCEEYARLRERLIAARERINELKMKMAVRR